VTSFIIYLITCTVNGKKYVGQSEVPLEERWQKHVASSRCPTSKAYKKMSIVRAIAKHGSENFIREVIEKCSSYDAMDVAEIDWIAKLELTNPDVGYNIAKGGNAPMRGRKHTAASKALMRMAKLNPTDETRASLKAGQARANADPETIQRKVEAAKRRGVHSKLLEGHARFFENGMPEETKQKLSVAMSGEKNANYGKPVPAERKKKLSAAHQGKILSTEHKAAIARGVVGKCSSRGLNRRPVHVYENDEHVASYLRLEFVAEDMGVSVKTLRAWLCSGKKFGNRRYVQDESTISALRSK